MRGAHFHVDDFLPADDAAAMRADLDAHFADPHLHGEQHQVWNYWYVPPIYTYLRTAPQRVIGEQRVHAFHAALAAWSRETLGMTRVSWPNLSLYVDGCLQGLHNDSVNGRFGYVFSLTRDARRTEGGETIVLREGDPFRDHLDAPAAGHDLYDLIAPRFNRLAIFDDRMPHGVQRVSGSMDPVEGRIVLHGHIGEGEAFADGELAAAEVVSVVRAAIADRLEEIDADYHGPLVLRLGIAATGAIDEVRVLVDRVAHRLHRSAAALTDAVVATVAEIEFRTMPGATVATVPLRFGAAPA